MVKKGEKETYSDVLILEQTALLWILTSSTTPRRNPHGGVYSTYHYQWK